MERQYEDISMTDLSGAYRRSKGEKDLLTTEDRTIIPNNILTSKFYKTFLCSKDEICSCVFGIPKK